MAKRIKNFINYLLIFVIFTTVFVYFGFSVVEDRHYTSVLGHYTILDYQESVKTDNQKALIEYGVVVTANLSKTFWTVAMYNDSLIYAKTHVFVYINNTLEQVITDRNTHVFSINLHSEKILVRIKWVNSFREIQEIEQEFNGVLVTQDFLWRLAIVGIPSFIIAFIVSLMIVYIKKHYYEIKEGFEDE